MNLSTIDAARSIINPKTGDHIAHLFTNDTQRDEFLESFVDVGLGRKDRVLFVADEARISWLRRQLQTKRAQAALYNLVFMALDSADPTPLTGRALAEAVVRRVRTELAETCRLGLECLRVAGEWGRLLLHQTTLGDLLWMEAALDDLVHNNPCVIMGQYSQKSEPALLLKVLSAHPYISVGEQLCENIYYLPSDALGTPDPARAEYRYRLKNLVQHERSGNKARLLGNILHHSSDAVIVYNMQGRIIEWNRGAVTRYGYSEAEGLRLSVEELQPREERERINKLVRGFPDTSAAHYESRRLTRDGEEIEIWVSVSLLVDDNGQPAAAVSTERPLSEHLKADPEMLLQSAERYRSLIQNVNEYIYSVSYGADGTVTDTYHSPRCREITGYAPHEYRKDNDLWFNMIFPEDRPRVTTFLDDLRRNPRTDIIEHRIVRRDGVVRWVSNTCTIQMQKGHVSRLDGYILDITERKTAEQRRLQMEEQIQQAEKLESLGVLAGGIAHDFNNLLTIIIGNVHLALIDSFPGQHAKDHLHEIENAAMKASHLAAQMLAYSGRARAVVEHFDLTKLVQEWQDPLRALVPKSIAIEFELAENMPLVDIGHAQVRQILTGLVRNSIEAIREDGRICVRTGITNVDSDYLERTMHGPDAMPGLFAWLEVEDNGCGMSLQVKARIFDPFFSTKFTGRGLGLSVAQGIIRSQKGAIDVRTAPQAGTTVRLMLPVAQVDVPAETPLAQEAAEAQTQTGVILIVDDEEGLRFVAQRFLEHVGHKVLSAASGAEALEIFRRNKDRIDVVVLDLTMPGMDGVQVFDEMRKIRADLPVILSSGYNEPALRNQNINRQKLAGFLQKPYKPGELNDAVQRAFKYTMPSPEQTGEV